MAQARWKLVAMALSSACWLGCADGTAVDLLRSSLTVAPTVELQGETAVTPITVQVRNALGAPLAGVAVQLTASGAALPTTISPSVGVTDATGSFSTSLTAVTWGKVSITALLGDPGAALTASVDVTCTANGAQGPWVRTSLIPVRQRTVAGGPTPVQLLVGGQATVGLSATPVPVPNLCFRLSTDRPDVVLAPSRGRTGAPGSGAPVSVDVTSAAVGPVVVTATTPIGTATATIEFVASPAWSRVDVAAGSAPVDVHSVTIVSPGARLVTFADSRLWWSSDGGASWQASAVPGVSTWSVTSPTAWSELFSSPAVADLVVARVGPDLLRSADAGHSFARLNLAASGLRVHPGTGAWLTWTGTGAASVSPPTGDAWTPLPSPIPGSWSASGTTVRYAPSSAPGAWLAFVIPSTTSFSSGTEPMLMQRDGSDAWLDVTGALFTTLLGPSFEAASWSTSDLAGDLEDASSLFVTASASMHIGPGAYGTHTGAWNSTDGGSSWHQYTSWPGRLFASASTGTFHLDANGIVWKHTTGGFLDTSVGLPAGVRSLAFDRSRPGVVYAATPAGIYVTTTGGE